MGAAVWALTIWVTGHIGAAILALDTLALL